MLDQNERDFLAERMRTAGRTFITLEDLEALGPLPGNERWYRRGDMMTRVLMVTASEMTPAVWALIADQARASYEMWGKEVKEKISQPDHCDGVDENGQVVEGPYQNTVHFVSEAFFIDPASTVYISGMPVRVNESGVPIIKAVTKRAMNLDAEHLEAVRSGQIPYPEELDIWNIQDGTGKERRMVDAFHDALRARFGTDVEPELLYTASGRAGTYPFTRKRTKDEAMLSTFGYAGIQEAMCTREDARPVIIGMLNTEMRDNAFAWRRPSGESLVVDYSEGLALLQKWGADVSATVLNRLDPRVQAYLLSATGYWADNKQLGAALQARIDRLNPEELECIRAIAAKIVEENHLRGGASDHAVFGRVVDGTASREDFEEFIMALCSSRLARRMEPLTAMSPLVQETILREGGDGPYWFAQEREPFYHSAVRILDAVEEDRGRGLPVSSQA